MKKLFWNHLREPEGVCLAQPSIHRLGVRRQLFKITSKRIPSQPNNFLFLLFNSLTMFSETFLEKAFDRPPETGFL